METVKYYLIHTSSFRLFGHLNHEKFTVGSEQIKIL